MVALGVVGALGQCCIYLTIYYFDCFVLTVITTMRKFISVLGSFLLFNHALKTSHIVGVSIIFSAILLETYLKLGKNKKPKEKSF